MARPFGDAVRLEGDAALCDAFIAAKEAGVSSNGRNRGVSLSISLLVLATSLTAASPAAPEAVAAPAEAAAAPASPTPADPAAAAGTPMGASTGETPPESAAPAASPPAAGPRPASPASPETGTIVVTARGKPPREDPLQNLNAKSFEVVQSVDRKIVGPVSMGYAKHVPSPIRAGIHNVLMMLEEPTIFVNFLLQHRIGKAGETLARFTINAAFGFGGLIDVAKRPMFNLPYRPNGFADTMGFYGVRTGPYLFLPLIGSTTPRDLVGRMMDLALLPAVAGGPFKSPYYSPIKGTVEAIDYRVEVDADLRRLRDESPDAYVSMRQAYLDMRQAEIDELHGKKHAAPAPAAAPASSSPEAAPAPAPAPAPSSEPAPAPPAQAAPVPVPRLEAEPVATEERELDISI